jgi:hypothetical protein
MGKFRAFLIKVLSGADPPPRLVVRVGDVEDRLEKLERSCADLHAIYLKWRGYAAAAKQQLTIDAGAGAEPQEVTPAAHGSAASMDKASLRAIARKKGLI